MLAPCPTPVPIASPLETASGRQRKTNMHQKTRPPSSRSTPIGHETAPGGGPAARFRPRRLPVANGEILALRGDGTIERRDAAGTVLERWGPDDPSWADHAIRFGLHPSATTVHPSGRDVPGSKPPA